MAAEVQVAEYKAIVRGKAPSGATMGGNERTDGAAKALKVPNSTAMTKSGHTAVGSDKA